MTSKECACIELTHGARSEYFDAQVKLLLKDIPRLHFDGSIPYRVYIKGAFDTLREKLDCCARDREWKRLVQSYTDAILEFVRKTHLEVSCSNFILVYYEPSSRGTFSGYKQIRGFGADIIGLDEALFMTNHVILTAILPVAQELHTALFALSTPQDYGHPTVQLFNTKNDEGKTIFRIVRIGKGCDECQAKQIMCPHADSVVSEGISSDKQNEFACFYRDDPELRLQEYGGIVSNSTRYSFHPDYLRLLALRKHYPVRGPIDMIMVTIDPAAGGKNEWAFCACYYDTTVNMQVIIQTDGLCIKDVGPPEISDWLRRSIEHLRSRDEEFMDPPILIACENAPLIVGNTVAYYVEYHITTGTFQNVFMMREFGADKGPGVAKNNNNTEDMTRYAAMLLASEQVCFSERYSSCSPGVSVQTAKTKFITQLTQFKPHLIRVTADGQHINKIHGKAGGRNDDQAVAYIMQYYWYKIAMASANPIYARVRDYAVSWRVGYVKIIPTGQSEQQKRVRDEVLSNPHTSKRRDPVGYQNFDDSDNEIALPDDLLF